jgi:hypothetical protein
MASSGHAEIDEIDMQRLGDVLDRFFPLVDEVDVEFVADMVPRGR